MHQLSSQAAKSLVCVCVSRTERRAEEALSVEERITKWIQRWMKEWEEDLDK